LIERKEMGRPTKAVEAYNKALFEQGLIKCSTCKDIKSLDDFGNRTDMWNGKMTLCKPCNLIHNQQREDSKRADLNILKEAQGCMRCGYNEDGSKLHFHHINPSTKLFSIGKGVSYSPQKLQEEIDKCDLLCAACHCIVEPRTPKGWKSKSTLNK
jgi:hypothetical protein